MFRVRRRIPTKIRTLCCCRTFATAVNSFHINRISGSVGAEVLGVDLKALDATTTSKIYQAFLEHKVIFFRDQELSAQQFLDFASRLGKPVEYPFVKGIDDFPNIIRVLKKENETNNFGGIWHADTVYLDEPPKGTILMAQELPPHGGDTMFADQVAAYDSLSDGLKKVLDGLTCVNTSAKADTTKTREDRTKDSGHISKDWTSYHPAVRTHPETGKKSLYMNVAHTERFDGWTADESKPLLGFLHQHQVKSEYTCRFRWKPGSIAFWDNRQVLHYPINDYHGFRRSMLRITLAGDRPR